MTGTAALESGRIDIVFLDSYLPRAGDAVTFFSAGQGLTTDAANVSVSVSGVDAIAGFDAVDLVAGSGDLTFVAREDLEAGGGLLFLGTALTDVVEGTGEGDALNGGEGNDSLSGGAGDDILAGGPGHGLSSRGAAADPLAADGDDLLSGGGGNDTLDGGMGDDTLFGGADDDRLAGGAGTDLLSGDGGSDRFQFSVSDGVLDLGEVDVVMDFTDGSDLIEIAAGDHGSLTLSDLLVISADLAGGSAGDAVVVLDQDGNGLFDSGVDEFIVLVQNIDEQVLGIGSEVILLP